MRQDTNKFSIPTTYKGIKMKSKLEKKVALFLDYLKIKWSYEPKLFILKNGEFYKPDFYLPEHKQWIEVKGFVEEHQFEILRLLAEETKEEVIMISGNKIFMFHHHYKELLDKPEDGLQLGFCDNCKTHFLCTYYGSFHCGKCGTHNGDHDIKAGLSGIFNEINFHNEKLIKKWIEKHASSI